MKSSEAHEVPLSCQVLAVLNEAWPLRAASDFVFPSPGGGMLSDGTHSKLVRKLGFKWVPHGFRSSFRDWCAMNSIPREVAEAGLSHIVGSPVERAYAALSFSIVGVRSCRLGPTTLMRPLVTCPIRAQSQKAPRSPYPTHTAVFSLESLPSQRVVPHSRPRSLQPPSLPSGGRN